MLSSILVILAMGGFALQARIVNRRDFRTGAARRKMPMKKSKFTDGQIAFVLKRAEVAQRLVRPAGRQAFRGEVLQLAQAV